MKITLIAASLFLLAAPLHAQTRPNQLSLGGGGGGLGGFGSSSITLSLPATDRTEKHYSYIYAEGSDGTFVPTRFVSFDAAVKLGKAELAYRPKTIVEVAAECRAAKKQAKASNVANQ
jgi:hypothetical protein